MLCQMIIAFSQDLELVFLFATKWPKWYATEMDQPKWYALCRSIPLPLCLHACFRWHLHLRGRFFFIAFVSRSRPSFIATRESVNFSFVPFGLCYCAIFVVRCVTHLMATFRILHSVLCRSHMCVNIRLGIPFAPICCWQFAVFHM